MMQNYIEKLLEECNFKQKVEEELKKTPHPQGIVMDWGAIIAVVLPIVIKVLVEYVLPYVINKLIPWIIEQIKKKQEPSTWKHLKDLLKI